MDIALSSEIAATFSHTRIEFPPRVRFRNGGVQENQLRRAVSALHVRERQKTQSVQQQRWSRRAANVQTEKVHSAAGKLF